MGLITLNENIAALVFAIETPIAHGDLRLVDVPRIRALARRSAA